LGEEPHHKGRIYVQGVLIDGWLDRIRIRKSIHKLLARQAHEAMLEVS